MKNFKRLLALLLAGVMVLSMAACGNKEEEEEGGEELSYNEISAQIYDAELTDFSDEYANVTSASSVSEKYALSAIAEAKLLESAVLLPTSASGGNYAISRLAPYTIDFALWGNDMNKFYTALVTEELIESAHRDEMKAKWNEVKGTGTYLEWAKDYLTSKGYTLKDTYTEAYSSDPTTWDMFNSYLSVDSENVVNTYDSLLEYDAEGILQPALAEAMPTVSDDGLTYTFKIREGINWVDSQGRVIAEVCADDFVAGMQHLLDCCGGMEYLVDGLIVNATEYIDGTVDFSEVGVTALDQYTVEYKLTKEASYFTTMFGYTVFAPLCRTYYEGQGGGFGAEYEEKAATSTYGSSPDNIAYCGPFLITSYTAENSIVFTQNESYWNKDAMNITKYVRLFNAGDQPTKAYEDMKAGTIDGCSLNTSALELAKQDGLFDKYQYVTTPDATIFTFYINLNRQIYHNFNDDTVCVSPQDEEAQGRTNAAVNNVHFRRALLYSMDRVQYNAQAVGDDLAAVSLVNSYTPWNLVILDEEVTVDINGTATTFPAGTAYGEILQAQLTADGSTIVAYNPEADNGSGSGYGYDGWYNPEEAVKELEVAIEELAADGVEITAENPIQIDYVYYTESETFTNKANVIKQSVESVLGGKVQINLIATDYTGWLYSAYYPQYGYEANYDISDCSGWAPDYGDPSTFLDTFIKESGYCNKSIGIY